MTTEPIRPTAEGLPAINRRKFFVKAAGAAAVPSLALVTGNPVEAGPVEPVITRLERAAEHVAVLLDEWLDLRRIPGAPRPLWCAEIHPSSSGRGYWFGRPPAFHQETAIERVARLEALLIEAKRDAHPEISDWRVIRDEENESEGSVVGAFFVIGHKPKRRRA